VLQRFHTTPRQPPPSPHTRCVAVCCSVLQRVAVCCRVLHYVAVCCSEYIQRRANLHLHYIPGVLQCVAVRYSVLQRVTACCSVLQCVHPTPRQSPPSPHPRCGAVCCSVLQSVAVRCTVLHSVLQCVVVCCSSLHCVAACCTLCCTLFIRHRANLHLQRHVGGAARKPRSINKETILKILMEIMRWGLFQNYWYNISVLHVLKYHFMEVM